MMANFHEGEVWFVSFPLEENHSQIINRPVIVLDEDRLGVLSVKVTKHKVRTEDPYDTPILYWQQAHLRFASTARVAKVMTLHPDAFLMKIGDLHPDDLARVEELYINFVDGVLPEQNNKGAVKKLP